MIINNLYQQVIKNTKDIEEIKEQEIEIPVTSVNGETGDVVLTASDINASNAQSVQANLERIDGLVEDISEDYLPNSGGSATGSITVSTDSFGGFNAGTISNNTVYSVNVTPGWLTMKETTVGSVTPNAQIDITDGSITKQTSGVAGALTINAAPLVVKNDANEIRIGNRTIEGIYQGGNGNIDVLSNLNMQSGKTIKNIPTPSADGDAANKKYVDDHSGGGGGGPTDITSITSAYGSAGSFDINWALEYREKFVISMSKYDGQGVADINITITGKTVPDFGFMVYRGDGGSSSSVIGFDTYYSGNDGDYLITLYKSTI